MLAFARPKTNSRELTQTDLKKRRCHFIWELVLGEMKIGAKDIQHLSERGHLMRLQEFTNQNEILTASSSSAMQPYICRLVECMLNVCGGL